MGVNTRIDVSEKDLNNLHQLLTRYLPNTKVWAFGSRVKWTSRPDSDLDLVVFATKEQSRQVHNFKDALQESSLPFRVDVLVWDNIPDTFRENIQQQYFVLVDLDPPNSRVMSSELHRLDSLLEITSSKRIHMADYVENGIPFYRGKEVIERAKGNAISTELFITDEKFREIKNKFGSPEDGDILLTSVGTLGVPYFIFRDGDFYFKDGNVTWFRKFASSLNSKFLYYWLVSPATQQRLDEISIGSTQKALTITALKSLEIPLPNLKIQQEVVEILDSLSHRITLLRETNATLEAIAQALFKSWFVDFDPVHAKMQGTQPEGMDEQTAALFPDSFEESELGLVPAGWAVGTLGDMSKNNSTPFDFSKVEKVVFVNTGDVSNGEFLHQNYSLKEGLPGQAKKAIYEDDILFSEIRPKNGRFAYVNFDAKDYVVSTKFMVLRAINNIPPRYLYQVLRQTETIEYFHVIAESRSGTFPQITFDSVKTYKLIKPSSVCLEKYIECVNPIFHKVDLLNKQAQTLADLRDTLLPRLISGQLRVGDVDATI